MGKKRRLKKQKQSTAIRRQKLQSSSTQNVINPDPVSKPISLPAVSAKLDSIYAYPVDLVKKDLVKSFILSIGAVIILLLLNSTY